MEEENIQKAALLESMMLNQAGFVKLCNLNVVRNLVLSLSLNDFNLFKDRDIYFYPIFSPASLSSLKINLPAGARIIGVDINVITLFSPEEGAAILLHEIGHALNSSLKGVEGEYMADDYAVCHGYGEHIISGLEKGMLINPSAFDKEITDKRINRLK
jgi:hypothetical protein